MNRSSLPQRLSIASIFFLALLLVAAVACAGGGDDVADKGGDGNGEVVTPADGGNGNGNGRNEPPTDEGDTSCKGNVAKIVNVTLKEQGASGKWKISVDKDTVEITMRGRVCWDISGLEDGYKLTMSGKTGSDSQFPTRSTPPNPINSGAPNSTGTFQYDLILTQDGNEVGKLDPSVIIRPGDS